MEIKFYNLFLNEISPQQHNFLRFLLEIYICQVLIEKMATLLTISPPNEYHMKVSYIKNELYFRNKLTEYLICIRFCVILFIFIYLFYKANIFFIAMVSFSFYFVAFFLPQCFPNNIFFNLEIQVWLLHDN